MSVPHSVLAGGWIAFAVVLVLIFLFSWIYIRLFQHHELSEISSTLTAIFALSVTLLTSALVPVDVFLVSYMKHSNGTFKDWATENSTRVSMENTITYAYYTLYGLVGLFIFLFLPFMYFYYEEKEDDQSFRQRACSAIKFTLVFVLLACAILITGALVPLKTLPSKSTSIGDKFAFLKDQLAVYGHGDQAMSILVGILSMIGMLSLITYTGYGMSALPLGMIRCCKKYDDSPSTSGRLTKKERDEERARMIRAKSRAGRNLTRFERNELRRIEQNERLQHRIQRKKAKSKSSWCGKLLLLLKPFEVVFGLTFLAISLVIMISLTITSIDKALHSLGPKTGYSLPRPKIPNPLNIMMVNAQKVFPLDYILFGGITLFFVFASMNGIKRIGIRCCCITVTFSSNLSCIKMFKIRTGRTMPQALLFMVFLMMFMVLALNILLFTISPQYIQYGNQRYAVMNGTKWIESKSCSTKAPEGECVMSRVASLLNLLFFKAWFFGAFYYWSVWCFIGVYLLAFMYNLYNVFRLRPEEEMISSDESESSDTEVLIQA